MDQDLIIEPITLFIKDNGREKRRGRKHITREKLIELSKLYKTEPQKYFYIGRKHYPNSIIYVNFEGEYISAIHATLKCVINPEGNEGRSIVWQIHDGFVAEIDGVERIIKPSKNGTWITATSINKRFKSSIDSVDCPVSFSDKKLKLGWENIENGDEFFFGVRSYRIKFIYGVEDTEEVKNPKEVIEEMATDLGNREDKSKATLDTRKDQIKAIVQYVVNGPPNAPNWLIWVAWFFVIFLASFLIHTWLSQ